MHLGHPLISINFNNKARLVSLRIAEPFEWGETEDRVVTFYGFLGKRRAKGPQLSFYDLQLNGVARRDLQIVSSWDEEGSTQHKAHLDIAAVPAYSPVCITGRLKLIEAEAAENDDSVPAEATTPGFEDNPARPARRKANSPGRHELKLESVQPLNTFPKDIIVSKDAVWPPKSRHLQMRFDTLLYERLRFRSDMVRQLGETLRGAGFIAVETPLLFKSTPEGAREFLVPTRQKGFAYALPQSPQQYKQILMAGGVSKYYQFAKCFRDEDHRADRQPEFTQLDLEMAYASGADVKIVINDLIKSMFQHLRHSYRRVEMNGSWIPVLFDPSLRDAPQFGKIHEVNNMSYSHAMAKYGVDKPDLRIQPSQASTIMRPSVPLFPPEFIKMITSLHNPIVEFCKFRFTGTLQDSARFIRDFFDALPKTPHKLGRDSTPGVFLFDSSKPLQGLSALGHAAAETMAGLEYRTWPRCEDGDVIIVHARKREHVHGGSTELGRLRKLIYDTAVEKGLLPKDHSFRFTWVERFPMFMPNDDDPGQGGSAGFKATHHPFTAPLRPLDFDMLSTSPLNALADHYDLVVNGVEIGGGSRRVHVAEVQEYIMRDILKMTDEGVGQFSHLLEALRAGCPPHAGFAIGFDRLLAVLCEAPSVRDVIAFPKTNKGEDQLVGSPSKTTLAQQKTYHLFMDPEPTTSAE